MYELVVTVTVTGQCGGTELRMATCHAAVTNLFTDSPSWKNKGRTQNLIKKLADVCNRKETKIKECRRKKSKKNKVERREPKGLIWSVNLLQHVQYL